MDEHVVQNDCDLQLSSSTLEGNFNYAPHLGESSLYQHITKAEDCDSYSAPQWIGYQQMPPYYVEYLVGNGISDMQGEIPHDTNGIGCSFTSEESFLSMEAHQKQGLDTAAQHKPNMSGITTSRRTYMRQKATDADRRRRTRIAASLDALEDLLPQPKQTATAGGPLEEMLGNLMETSPSAAIKLLESRGLYMMPINARSS